ncbi:MAG: Rpn family recombination-promoting nuclease/putative transposase [Chitinivibrionia bacterium]|nr:Rpn family recombination-promoting nuclease/putative transposase [Chitinivibrionia bacterium]
MPKYLDPKNDLLFKKVFGEHKDLCISLLNSLLKFEGNAQIDWIEYDTAELIPQIPALKDTIVDVRCKDKNGRHFIVEMQMNWTGDFEQRVLLNASKVYVRQIKKGEDIILAQPVYSLNLVNDIFDKDPKRKDEYYHHYKIVNILNTEKQIKGLEFVFLELPKYKPKDCAAQDYFDLWLRFLTEINEKTKSVPDVLLQKKELSDALKCVEESSLTSDELELYDRVLDAIWAKKILIEGSRRESLEEGRAEGRAEGKTEKAVEIAKKMKKRGISTKEISEFTGISAEKIENL